MHARYSVGMEKAKHTSQEDITQQHYKGPTSAVAALGEGALQTKFLMLGGFVAGGIAALVAPKQSAKLFGAIRGYVNTAIASENGFLKLAGTFGKFTLDIGKETADLVQKIGFVKNGMGRFKKERIEAVIDGAIITSGAASILGAFSGGTAGVASARAGKKQFETAKEEILTLRQKVAQQDNEIEDLKTAQAAKNGTLKVSSEEVHNSTLSAEEQSADTKPETLDALPKETPDSAIKNEAADKSHAENLTAKPQATWTSDITSQKAADTTQLGL